MYLLQIIFKIRKILDYYHPLYNIPYSKKYLYLQNHFFLFFFSFSFFSDLNCFAMLLKNIPHQHSNLKILDIINLQSEELF